MAVRQYSGKPGEGMDIRYSPYNSPFTPSEPKGVYWIGLEFKDQPHSAHVWAWLHQQNRRALFRDMTQEEIHLKACRDSADAFRRPFLSVCGCAWCRNADAVGTGFEVAVPVTPPLSPMGGTFGKNRGVV
ncbi:MAG: hypothetical protein JWM78_456 [Verrucomicrobiaceae bacterium]|nr:hypothetical protein [Verrucomicrobiaceae bacterium]